MRLSKIILYLTALICSIAAYFHISILLNTKRYVIFSLSFYIILVVLVVLFFVKLIRIKSKTQRVEKVEYISVILICFFILCSKTFIDKRNLQILKGANQDISITKLVSNANQNVKETAEYDSLFKIDKYENTAIYYTDEIKPALKLIHAYIDKARLENIKLFGEFTAEPLKIKFDYRDEVFKKRNSTFKDYEGLYFYDEKEAYLLVEDCFSKVLALNFKSSDLRKVFIHEYTHHVFNEFLDSEGISKNKIPIWFMEGVCDYVGYEGNGGNTPGKMLDFNELNTSKQWENNNNKGYDIYEQSHLAVRQLIIMKGEGVIKDILLKIKDKDFKTAFSEVTSVSLEEYEKFLKEDYNNHWKKYNKMLPDYDIEMFSDVKIECLENYMKIQPGNTNALLDLATLYEGVGALDKAKIELNTAVEKRPESAMAWRRLGLICIEMDDFDSSISAFEQVINLDIKPASAYIKLAHLFLLKDVNKAVEVAQKAMDTDSTSFVKNQVQVLESFQSNLINGKPYEGCLKLINTSTINSNRIEKALIEKLLRDYPDIKNSARSELEKIKDSED